MSDHIEALAHQKGLFQLSPAERAEVMSEMTEEEYEQLHLTLSTLHSMDDDARPSPLLRERLLRRMAEEAAQPRLPWYRRPVPMWQAAAAALLVGIVGAACFFQKKSLRTVETHVAPVEVRVQHDTIWQTQWTYRDHVVYRRQPVASAETQPVEPPQALLKMPQLPDAVPEDSLLAVRFTLPVPPTGTPLSALPELMQFLGGERKM